MLWDQLPLWQKIALYTLLLIALFVYVKATKLSINGRPLISTKYRVMLALFFPLLLLLAIFLGALILALILVILFILFLLSLFGRRKFRFFMKRL